MKHATLTITTIRKSGAETNFSGFVRHFETRAECDEYVATGEKIGEEAPIAVDFLCFPREGNTTISDYYLNDARAGRWSMTSAELKRARKSLGLTQQGLADQLNRSKSAVEKWEAGPVDPVAAIAVRAMLAFGLPDTWPGPT